MPCQSARSSASNLFTRSTTLKSRPRAQLRIQDRDGDSAIGFSGSGATIRTTLRCCSRKHPPVRSHTSILLTGGRPHRPRPVIRRTASGGRTADVPAASALASCLDPPESKNGTGGKADADQDGQPRLHSALSAIHCRRKSISSSCVAMTSSASWRSSGSSPCSRTICAMWIAP